MDENQNQENITNNQEQCSIPKKDYTLLKVIMSGILIFVGSFCAFYVVVDWHMKMLFAPPMRQFHRMERMMERDMHSMDKMMNHKWKHIQKGKNVIHLEQTKDFYKIYIDLKAFDNNENNLQVTTNSNILTIRGRSIRKTKHDEQIAEFQQNYMFGDNVKLADLTKETKDNYLIISIPIRDTENNNEEEEE